MNDGFPYELGDFFLEIITDTKTSRDAQSGANIFLLLWTQIDFGLVGQNNSGSFHLIGVKISFQDAHSYQQVLRNSWL